MHNGFFTGSSQPCTEPRMSSLSYPVHVMQKNVVVLINACQEGFEAHDPLCSKFARWQGGSCYLLSKRKFRVIMNESSFFLLIDMVHFYLSPYNLRISQLSAKQPRHLSVLIDPGDNFSVCSWQDGIVLCDL